MLRCTSLLVAGATIVWRLRTAVGPGAEGEGTLCRRADRIVRSGDHGSGEGRRLRGRPDRQLQPVGIDANVRSTVFGIEQDARRVLQSRGIRHRQTKLQPRRIVVVRSDEAAARAARVGLQRMHVAASAGNGGSQGPRRAPRPAGVPVLRVRARAGERDDVAHPPCERSGGRDDGRGWI